MLIREDHLLANVRHEFNAVYVQADGADATLYYGRGAGRMPTASAVVGDIVDIARRDGAPAPPPFIYGEKRPLIDRNKLRGRYYIRLTTLDNPGVLGAVCTTLGDFGVSISSCIQKEEHEENAVHVVLMTHETMEHAVYEAAAAIDEAEYTREPSQILRVL
jgi:homoserine dehydrogenase